MNNTISEIISYYLLEQIIFYFRYIILIHFTKIKQGKLSINIKLHFHFR